MTEELYSPMDQLQDLNQTESDKGFPINRTYFQSKTDEPGPAEEEDQTGGDPFTPSDDEGQVSSEPPTTGGGGGDSYTDSD